MVARVGPVSRILELPEGSRIHPTCHVSQIKRVLKQTDVYLASLPIPTANDRWNPHPKSILEERALIHQVDNHSEKCWFHSDGAPEAEATWMPVYKFSRLFPDISLVGKAKSGGEEWYVHGLWCWTWCMLHGKWWFLDVARSAILMHNFRSLVYFSVNNGQRAWPAWL